MARETNQKGKRPRPVEHPVKRPGDKIAEDSSIVYDAIPNFDSDTFAELRREVYWQQMFHAQGQVPRLVCCQGTFGTDGSMPVYRHPSDQSLPLLHYSPLVDSIRNQVETIVGHPMNHVLIQLYRNGEDYISEHSDKTLDIVRGSSIVNVSLGAQRTMRLRTKKSSLRKQSECQETSRITELVPMPHGSVFVLGPKSNERWLHGINHDKRPLTEKSKAETAYDGQRISLTFRHIGTFLDSDCQRIWGQGACSKTQPDSGNVINGVPEMTQQIINAFGYENQQSDFNWDSVYGNGFDVLHFQQAPREDLLLFLSGDETNDLKVKIFLEELRHPYRVERAVLKAIGSSARPEICLRDLDSQRTQVFGAFEILLHLNSTRSVPNVQNASPPETPALLGDLKHATSTAAPVRTCEMLESALEGRDFIAGEFSVADCAFWPVLHYIVSHSASWSPSQFPRVASYYERVLSRRSVEIAIKHEDHLSV